MNLTWDSLKFPADLRIWLDRMRPAPNDEIRPRREVVCYVINVYVGGLASGVGGNVHSGIAGRPVGDGLLGVGVGQSYGGSKGRGCCDVAVIIRYCLDVGHWKVKRKSPRLRAEAGRQVHLTCFFLREREREPGRRLPIVTNGAGQLRPRVYRH